MGELLGYARVSTLKQNADLQRDALSAAGCWRVFTDHPSRARPLLRAALFDHGARGLPVYRLLADHDAGLLLTQRMANLIGRAATHAGVPRRPRPPPNGATAAWKGPFAADFTRYASITVEEPDRTVPTGSRTLAAVV